MENENNIFRDPKEEKLIALYNEKLEKLDTEYSVELDLIDPRPNLKNEYIIYLGKFGIVGHFIPQHIKDRMKTLYNQAVSELDSTDL